MQEKFWKTGEKLNNSSFCASCGAFLPAGSICPECNIAVTTIRKPNFILPNCAQHLTETGELLPQADPKQNEIIMPRECCRCGKYWKCTSKQWIEGPCPHCGATGLMGTLEDNLEPDSALMKLIKSIEVNPIIKNFNKINEENLNKKNLTS